MLSIMISLATIESQRGRNGQMWMRGGKDLRSENMETMALVYFFLFLVAVWFVSFCIVSTVVWLFPSVIVSRAFNVIVPREVIWSRNA